MAQKKRSVSASAKTTKNTREPTQHQASTVNYGAWITALIIFLILAVCVLVSYFVSGTNDGDLVKIIRQTFTGLLGWGYWIFGPCLLLAAYYMIPTKSHLRWAGLHLLCLCLLPIFFAAFVGILSYEAPTGTTSEIFEELYETGNAFLSGGAIGGFLTYISVKLLSRLGAGILLFVGLLVTLVFSIADPSVIFGAHPERQEAPKLKQTAERPVPEKTARNRKVTIPNFDRSDSSDFSFPSAQNSGKTASQAQRIRTSNVARAQAYDLPVDMDSSSAASAAPAASGSVRTRSAASAAASSQTEKRAAASVPLTSEKRSAFETPSVSTPAASSAKTAPASAKRSPAASSKGKTARSAYNLPMDDELDADFNEVYESILAENEAAQKNPRPSYTAAENGSYAHPASSTRPSLSSYQSKHSAPEASSAKQQEPARSILTPTAMNTVTLGKNAVAAGKEDMQQEKITKADVQEAAQAVAEEITSAAAGQEPATYVYPEANLLRPSVSAGVDSEDEILETKERLEEALQSFGINSSVVKITHGPTVTRYDIELERGVKLAKVTNLAGDLALSLGAANVRIAPIPGGISMVGIEVPNKIVNSVSLREIIESDNFKNAKSKLTFAIGKDIGGEAIVGNISKLPHMLIAGTTGSGKSVCMNSLIISLLYKARPDEVKFVMIDPKMVELGIYNSIPHLYVPVVTDPKKAAGALQWSVVEMLKRYRMFSEAGVRDLETYNTICKANGEPTLPCVVIVIDELADLMMAASKEVEESICRVAQMGRAAGMHLIIATQRPSADVITGLMKANIPSRIAFAVSSTLESRIILDQGGAEKLIGMGDMLFSPVGIGKPKRVQGAFVSDEEREKVINFISQNCDGSAEKNEEIVQFMNKAMQDTKKGDSSSESDSSSSEGSLAGEYDEVLPQAAEVVLEMKSCSVSMLQRRLKLGYSRAARVVDQLEELGIVGPYEGAKPRSVVITREDWNQLQVKLGYKSADDFALASEMSEDADGYEAEPEYETEGTDHELSEP